MKKTLNKNSSSKSKTQKNSKNKQAGGANGPSNSRSSVKSEFSDERLMKKLGEIKKLYNETIQNIYSNYKRVRQPDNKVNEDTSKGIESLINHMHKEAIASYNKLHSLELPFSYFMNMEIFDIIEEAKQKTKRKLPTTPQSQSQSSSGLPHSSYEPHRNSNASRTSRF